MKTQKETAICNAVLNLNAFQFPMYLVKANDFTEMGQLTRHLTESDSVEALGVGGRVYDGCVKWLAEDFAPR